MKPQNLHAQEDRLLDFVYGELPPQEARAVESHLEGCARCSELLADIRGVRTTMAQLPMESAPDAGLESLLAYAQQAARNAAAGPAPKPTWWRRWLVPVVGVAAVCVFGIVSIQVSKSMAIKPDLTAAKSEEARRDAPAAPAQMQAPAAPTPVVAEAKPSGEAYQDAPEEGAVAQAPSMTPPPPAPAAKLDKALMEKEAPRKNAFVSGPKKQAPDWGNAGAGAGFERAKDAEDEQLALKEKTVSGKKAKSYDYDERDAMTQVAPLKKPKAVSRGSTQESLSPEPMPAPAAAQPAEEEAPSREDGMMAQANVQQAESKQSSLRVGGGRAGGLASTENKPVDAVSGDDFDDLMGAKASTSRREQQASQGAPMPAPSSASTRAPSQAPMRPETKGESSGSSLSELTRLADAALRSGDRVREAQYLRLALDAGATGSARLGLLNRLCDAEFAIGRRDAAIEACNQVLEESPRSGAAQVARKRLSSEAPEADTAKARPGSKAANKAATMEAPAASTPTLKE